MLRHRGREGNGVIRVSIRVGWLVTCSVTVGVKPTEPSLSVELASTRIVGWSPLLPANVMVYVYPDVPAMPVESSLVTCTPAMVAADPILESARPSIAVRRTSAVRAPLAGVSTELSVPPWPHRSLKVPDQADGTPAAASVRTCVCGEREGERK